MADIAFPDIETELQQLQDVEARAKALHELEEDADPNILDRLAEACRQKILILQELECLARIQESKAKVQFDVRAPLASERIQ